MRRRKRKDDNTLFWVFVLGIPLFLLMVHPLIFWLVFVPLVIIGIVNFVNWLKK